MRKLVLSSLLAAGLIQGLSGCIISSDDDDDVGDGGDGGDDFSDVCGTSFEGLLYQPTWECPPDADIITFTAFPAGSSGSLEPDEFDCGEPQPPSICYDPGTYDIEVLPEGSIGEFAALSDEIVDGVDGDLFEPDFAFTQDGGFFLVSWTLDGVDAGTACADGEEVEVVAILADDPKVELVDSAPCVDGSAIFPADLLGWPAPGDYSLDIALVDSTGMPISEPYPIVEESLLFADELFDLGTVDLLPLL